MNLVERARIVAQLGRALWSWRYHDLDTPSPVPGNPKFRSPRQAVELIPDGAVLADSGLGGQQRSSMLYWAIRESFERRGRPKNLTVVNVGGHGGRGRVPGTLEELGLRGLCTRLITGHVETFHAMQRLAEAGACEIQCLPLGILTKLFEAQGRGEESIVSAVGVGTYVDPRVGPGSPVAGSSAEQLVAAEGERLRYRLPPIDVALFNLPAADRHGNVYVDGCASIGESRELARAARRNGGVVIANVGVLARARASDVFLPADMLDAIVYHPDTEQIAGVFHRDPWLLFTTRGDVAVEEGLERVRFVNALARVERTRSRSDELLLRLAASTLLENARAGSRVSIGTGLPERIPQVVVDMGRLGDLDFVVESGVVGGAPTSGAFFGAAVRPREIIPSVEVFHRCDERLDATCLGALEVDERGNVNVSKRGDGPRGYVGPGGFIDFAAAADTIVFVLAWMRGGRIDVAGNALRIAARGTPKFVERVAEVTFSGPRALSQGKKVFYVTHAGVFRLTEGGIELVGVAPGVDVRRDILEVAPMKLLVADGVRRLTI